MAKLRRAFSISILIIVIWSTPTLAPTSDDFNSRLLLTNDIIADFLVLSSLLGDVEVSDNHLIINHAHDLDSAVNYLAQGFEPNLAETIAGYYLVHVPEFDGLAVVPTDSIPVLTAADIPYLQIRRLSPQQVIIDRFFVNCYLPGDLYLYRITATFNDQRWIISDLSLIPSSHNL